MLTYAANYDFEDSALPWQPTLRRSSSQVDCMIWMDCVSVRLDWATYRRSTDDDESNSMGVTVIEPEHALPREAEPSKPRRRHCDCFVHMGLHEDTYHATTIPGIDIIIGGHHHIATRPPIVVTNLETGNQVPVVHSGAFSKFVGRVDLVIRDGKIKSFDHALRPVANFGDENGVLQLARKPEVVDILEEYEEALATNFNTSQVIGYANETLRRYGKGGGDSMLGNFAAEAMRFYPGVETEIAPPTRWGFVQIFPQATLRWMRCSTPCLSTIRSRPCFSQGVKSKRCWISYRMIDWSGLLELHKSLESTLRWCNPDNPYAADVRINGLPPIRMEPTNWRPITTLLTVVPVSKSSNETQRKSTQEFLSETS